MLNDQEKATLKVLLGKHIGMDNAFGNRELRVILLIAQTWAVHPRGFSEDAERLAASFQQYLDNQAEGVARSAMEVPAMGEPDPEQTEPVPEIPSEPEQLELLGLCDAKILSLIAEGMIDIEHPSLRTRAELLAIDFDNTMTGKQDCCDGQQLWWHGQCFEMDTLDDVRRIASLVLERLMEIIGNTVQ